MAEQGTTVRKRVIWTGSRITQLRVMMDLTQEDLARIIGVSVSAVSRWERDVARPKGLHVMRSLNELAFQAALNFEETDAK